MPAGGRQQSQLSYLARPRLTSMRSFHTKPTLSSASLPSANDRRRYKPRKATGGGRYDQLKKGGVPDYTDYAYKEAVGKLKSMLSDTYSPPSKYHHIHHSKGDDSDDEGGLSFTMSDTTRVARLGSYRRPLSSKPYLPPAPEAPPLPATAAPPELLSFIERQEEYIEQLEKESQYCRDELSQLLGKVKDLISENESLHAQQKSTNYKTHDGFDEKRIDSANTVCNCKYRPHLEGPTIVFESRISELEAQLTQVRMDLKKSQEEAVVYKRKLMENDPTSSSSEFYRQIESLHREKRDLSESLNKLQSAVAQLREKESDSTRKVLRTQDVAEKAQMDKQQADMEVQRLKSELDHQHQRLLDVLSEQTRKVAEERSQSERRYLQHVEQLSAELTVQRDAATKLQLELERHLRVEDDLRRDLAAKNLTADNVRKELNAKIASLQSELATALTERDSLEQELSTNRMSGERSERANRQEASRLQVEVNALRQRIERNDTELIQARRENLRLSEQISIQESEIAIYKSRVGEMDEGGSKRASTVRELESVVEKQSQAMNLLTHQCHSLTQKLDDASAHHKQEMEELQSRLEFLTSRLDTSPPTRQWPAENYQPPVEQYQEHFEPEVAPYQNPYPVADDTSNISHTDVFEEINQTPTETNITKVGEGKPILSRVNSRGERSESPLVQKDRKSPLGRRESRMQMQAPEYPTPKQPEQQPQRATISPEQKQRGQYSPENNFKVNPEYSSEAAPYTGEPDQGSYEHRDIDSQQIPEYNAGRYTEQEPYQQGQQPPYDNTSNYYPPEEPVHYSPAPQPVGAYDYGEQDNDRSGAAPYYSSPDANRLEQERTPSRESQRMPYHDNTQGYQPEPAQGYQPENIRTRKSSSNESTGPVPPNYGQQSDAHFQQGSIEGEKYQSRDMPKQSSRPQMLSSTESLSGSEQRSQDVGYDATRPKISPQGSTVRRDGGAKVAQRSQRNTPTKLQ